MVLTKEQQQIRVTLLEAFIQVHHLCSLGLPKVLIETEAGIWTPHQPTKHRKEGFNQTS